MQTKTTLQKCRSHMAAVFAIAIISHFLVSCEKEKAENSPAWKIRQSEKLSIPSSIELPSNLPNGNTRVVTYYAEGVQKYKAQVKPGTTTELEWVFVAPDAILYDATNNKTGTHGAGPHWQLSPGDSVFAQAFAPARTAPGQEPGSIDWLLLKARTDKVKTGKFADVAYIQRIATTGGKAPATAPVAISDTKEVAYTAIYRFTKINP